MYGEASIISLARIEREKVHVHVVCVQLYLRNGCINISEQYKLIGIGSLYLKPNLKRFDYSYLKLWWV